MHNKLTALSVCVCVYVYECMMTDLPVPTHLALAVRLSHFVNLSKAYCSYVQSHVAKSNRTEFKRLILNQPRR